MDLRHRCGLENRLAFGVAWLVLLIGASVGNAMNIKVGGLAIEMERVYLAPNKAALDVPLEVVFPDDGTNRMIVAEKQGRIRLIKDGVASSFLDLQSVTYDNVSNGLLGLALHPNYSNSGMPGFGKFYTYRTVAHDNGATFDFVEPGTPVYDLLLTEWEVDENNPDIADPTSGRDIFRGVHIGNGTHPGGKLDFGPENYLYISVGTPPQGLVHAQQLDKIQGKILRIDPLAPADTPGSSDPASANGKYRIPAANPFVNEAGAFDEIYARGFRHPYRFSVDDETGLVFVGDVGQGAREEIAVVQAGENHGWPYREGTVPGVLSTPNPAPTMVEPIAEYSHVDGISVMGGYVYRGSAIPELEGIYIFAEYQLPSDPQGDGRFFWLNPYDENGDLRDFSEIKIHDFAFGGDTCVMMNEVGCDYDLLNFGVSQDADGEIYVMGQEANRAIIYKVTEAFPVGDYNRDGFVDEDDLEVWQDAYGSATVGSLEADGNGDGRVTAADYTVWRDRLGNSWDSIRNISGSGASASVTDLSAVPEPSAALLLLIGGGLVAVMTMHRQAAKMAPATLRKL